MFLLVKQQKIKGQTTGKRKKDGPATEKATTKRRKQVAQEVTGKKTDDVKENLSRFSYSILTHYKFPAQSSKLITIVLFHIIPKCEPRNNS